MVWWAFFLGASIASFLNVVAYRVPLGLSLNGSSFCPYCVTPISIRDNIPVFGWLRLGGRCRTCRLPISTRYPINEAFGGMIVLSIYIATMMMNGWNLPGRFLTSAPFGVSLNFGRLDPDLMAIACLYSTVILFLFATEMLASSDGRMPAAGWLVALTIVGSLEILGCSLQPVRFDGAFLSSGSAWRDTSLTRLLGLGVGCFVGSSTGSWGSDRHLSWLLIGICFGWQFVAVLALVVSATRLLVPVLRSQPLWLSTLLVLVSWRLWDAGLRSMGTTASIVVYGLMASASMLIFLRFDFLKKDGKLVVE